MVSPVGRYQRAGYPRAFRQIDYFLKKICAGLASGAFRKTALAWTAGLPDRATKHSLLSVIFIDETIGVKKNLYFSQIEKYNPVKCSGGFNMKSQIAQAIQLQYEPVAILWSDEKPEGAMQFTEGKWGCVMWLAVSAAKGRTAVADRKTFGCFGGGVGLGFGNQYLNFPGGMEGFCHFLSSGNAGRPGGPEIAEKIKAFMTSESHENFLNGERYIKNPELTEKFVEALPMMDVPAAYVVFKPLSSIDPAKEKPRTILFFVNPDQLSALTVLANYARGGNENVIMPYAAGCQNIGIYPYREARSDRPRAVVGLTDLSARVYVRKQLGDGNFMTFAAPFALFEEMEHNVPGSFLERHTWLSLLPKAP